MMDGSDKNDSIMDASPGPSYKTNLQPSRSAPVNTAAQSPLYGQGSDQYGGDISGRYFSCQPPGPSQQPAYASAFHNTAEYVRPLSYGLPPPLPPQSPAIYNNPPASAPSTLRPGSSRQPSFMTTTPSAFRKPVERGGPRSYAGMSPLHPPQLPVEYNILSASAPTSPQPGPSRLPAFMQTAPNQTFRYGDERGVSPLLPPQPPARYSNLPASAPSTPRPGSSRLPPFMPTTPSAFRIAAERGGLQPYEQLPLYPPQSPAGYSMPSVSTRSTPLPGSSLGQYGQFGGDRSGQYVSLQPVPSQPPNYISTTPIPAFITAKNRCAPSPYSISPNHPPQSPAGYNIPPPPVSAHSTPLPGPSRPGPYEGESTTPGSSTCKKPRLENSKPSVHTPLRIDIERARSGPKYNPIVEPISPALPEPLNYDSPFKAKIEELIQQSASLDGKISRTESKLAKLRKRGVQLEKSSTRPLEGPKPKKLSFFDKIYAENRKRALEADELIRNLMSQVDRSFPLYNKEGEGEVDEGCEEDGGEIRIS